MPMAALSPGEEVLMARPRKIRQDSTTPLDRRAALIARPVSPMAMSRLRSAQQPPKRRGKSALEVRYPPPRYWEPKIKYSVIPNCL